MALTYFEEVLPLPQGTIDDITEEEAKQAV